MSWGKGSGTSSGCTVSYSSLALFHSPPQQSVDSKCRELHILQDSTLSEKRKNQERLSTLLRDLNDMGVILGTKMEDQLKQLDSASEFTDEDFTKARIHLSNMRCEVRTLSKQREVLEVAEKEARDRAQHALAELGTCKAKITEVRTSMVWSDY